MVLGAAHLHLQSCENVPGRDLPASPQSVGSTGDPHPFHLCFLWEVFFSPSWSWQFFTAQFLQFILKLGCVAKIFADVFTGRCG